MNKAFVREPDSDSRVLCPRCGSAGTPVGSGPLDHHIRPEVRSRMQDAAWCCGHPSCDVVYFNLFEMTITVGELQTPVYPYDVDAPLCACFGFLYEDVESDIRDGQPVRIRELLRKSQSTDARCQSLAVDGQCCLRIVQKLYLGMRQQHS